ncbi:MAG: hypothetical protein QOI40_1804, partial [Alphaproteobacteria bacterium]|nr:hypothetical protein [Alphaproteobacteria bacterium]
GWRFLVDAADAHAFRNDDRATLRRELAANEAEERRLASAVAPDEPDMRARSQRSAGIVDQETLAEALGEGANVQHGRLFARRARSGKAGWAPALTWGRTPAFIQAGNSFSICLTLSMKALAAGECVRPRFEIKP